VILKNSCLALALALLVPVSRAATLTVTNADNVLIDGVTVAPGSLLEALQKVESGGTIRFNIPGPGPHYLVTPIGGYPLITADNMTIDGYSQPGASPNTNPILGGNNAVIQIVLDSTDNASAPDPTNPDLLQVRSTRLIDFGNATCDCGYGDSENCILGVVSGDNFAVKGISFLGRHTGGSILDPDIYCLAFVHEATNAHIQGCWFGLAPDGATVAGCAAAVAAFRYRTGGDVYSSGMIIGTDGDGINDPAEFNVMIGLRLAIAIEAPNLKVSGNYINVFPDGKTFFDVGALAGVTGTVESFENGRLCDNTVIGTDGNGVSDENERNIIGPSVYTHLIEFYGTATNVVIAGNYYGLGVDGSTYPFNLPSKPDFASLPDGSSVRVGSNGDGISDDLEGNLIYSIPGSRFIVSPGGHTKMIVRRNTMVNNGFNAVPFAFFENGGYVKYYSTVLDPPPVFDTDAVPNVTDASGRFVKGTVPSPNLANYPYSVIDVYVVDPAALVLGLILPQTYLGSFVEGSTEDLDPVINSFSFNLNSFTIPPSAQVALEVTYSQDPQATQNDRALSGPLSNPVDADPNTGTTPAQPRLTILRAGNTITLSWKADAGLFRLESTDKFKPANWLTVPAYTSLFNGQNSVALAIADGGNQFFRLVYQ
jgi:hypothetical protein